MRCKCVVVPKEEGENIRKKLSDDGMLRLDLKIISDVDFVYIPINDEVEIEIETAVNNFEEIDRASSYKELLSLPEDLEELLPTSFDIIGDIYIVKLADELLPRSKEIADAILKAHKNAEVVALDKGVQGEFRTRDLQILAGEKRTTTVHKEYGLMFEMDLTKVYFSPRLATERKRIVDLIEPGERVIDMFTGVGPFSIMIAKNAEPDIIYAIDKNPEAINYIIRNIKLNKIKNVAPMLGDAREIVSRIKRADRIIMNLPHSSLDFLDVGLSSVKPGGQIHLYAIVDKDTLDEIKSKILTIASPRNISIENVQEVHTYSPTECLYCFDLAIQ